MIFRNKTPSTEVSGFQNPSDWFLNIFNTSRSKVTEESAINTSEVYSSIKVLADDLAKYPIHLLNEKNGVVEKAIKHPCYTLFKDKPNKNMTIFEWKHLVMTQLNLWGNSYHYIKIGKNGQCEEIIPLDPKSTLVMINKSTYEVKYQTMLYDKQVVLASDEVLHFKNLSIDGLIGRSPIQVLRESIAGNEDGKKMSGNLFKREGIPLGVLKSEKTVLTPENKRLVAKLWDENLQNSNIAILNPDMEYTSVGIPQSDAQFIETMKYNKAEIASIYKVPPYKYGDYSGLTHGNAATQSLDYVKNVMLPFVTNLESELNNKIFTELDKRRGYYLKFNLESELRADSKTRAEFYKMMLESGVYTINDVLKKEDMSTIDKHGETRFMSLNFAPLDYLEEYQKGKAGVKNEKMDN